MTTIAYRNGVIAADTGLCGNGTLDCFADKIVKRDDGSVAGAAGSAWWITAFLDCFRSDHPFDQLPAPENAIGVVVSKRRAITLYESAEGKIRILPIRAKYYAIGSGFRFALGAMFAGAHPVDAVRAAIEHDDSTFGRIQSLRVGK